MRGCSILRTAAFTMSALAAAALPAAMRTPDGGGRRPLIPAHEWSMIRQVAANYSLSDEETWLLAAIRRHENGRSWLEFGIGGPMDSGHRAHRYRDGVKSFCVQAMWAAGTVKKHYDGDILKFARRYNPPHPERWAQGVSSLVRRLKEECGGRLPGPRPPQRPMSFP